MPTVQKPRSDWRGIIAKLKENSQYRMEHNGNYKLFLKQLTGDPLVDEASSDEADDYGRTNHTTYGREGPAEAEAINILKDMIYLQPRAEQEAAAQR